MLRNLTALLLVSSAAAQISFGPAREITEAISGGMAFAKPADMDGDGDMDAIAAERFGVRILWWENDGAGNFTKRPEWVWGDADWEVIGLEDWNGDGRIDAWLEQDFETEPGGVWTRRLWVAACQGNGSLADPVLLGEHQPAEFDPGADSFVARMNGDPHPDVVASEGVYYADATGTFPAPPIAVPGDPDGLAAAQRYDTTAFDAGSDGNTDLLNSGFYVGNRLMLIRNLGAAGFAGQDTLLAPEDGFHCMGHCVIPETGGVHRILVLAVDSVDASQTVRSFAMAADGTLSAQASFQLPATVNDSEALWTYPRATPDGRAFVLCYFDREFGHVPVTRIHEVTWEGGVLALTEIASHPGFVGQWQPAIADLNGDTLPDLFVSLPEASGTQRSTPNWIVWHAGKPSGGFAAVAGTVVAGVGNLKLHHTGDMDGDGDADVLCGVSALLRTPGIGSDRIELWRNAGGNFEKVDVPHGRDRIEIVGVTDVIGPAGVWHPENPNHGTGWPAERLDFLAQTYSSASHDRRFEWFFQDADGVFHRWTAAEVDGTDLTEVAWVDWDGDGTKDLLSWELTGTSQLDLTVRKAAGYGFGAGSGKVKMEVFSPTAPEVVDLDRDGDLDVVGRGYVFGSKPGYWLENDGNGDIAAVRGLSQELELAPDLDGDGHLDFTTTGQILLARPGLLFEARPFSAIGAPDNSRATFTDVDGDGDWDFVATTPTGGLGDYTQIRWWENRGNGHFFPQDEMNPGLPVAPPRWTWREQLKMGDLDGDGVADLVVASSTYPRLEWFRVTWKTGPQLFSVWMGAAGLEGHSAGPLADWDDDGVANWDEFAFGSDPAAGDPSHPGRPRLVRDSAGIRFTFHRRTDAVAAGLVYPMERATDLVAWEGWAPLLEITPAAGGYEKITVPVSPVEPKEFFRVAVPDPP